MSAVQQAAQARATRSFTWGAIALVAALAVSSLGSAITEFSLNVWVFRTTGSYAIFATLTALAAIPRLVLSPIAGVAIDRSSRARVLLACECVGLLVMAAVLVAIRAGRFSPALVGALMLAMACTSLFSWPAMGALATQLAAADQRHRVNGFTEVFMGAVGIGAPVLGVLAYDTIGLQGVAIFDIASYAACIVLLKGMRIAEAERSAGWTPARHAIQQAWTADLLAAYRWIAQRRGLVRVMLFFVANNFSMSMFAVLLAPYLLSFGTPGMLAFQLSLASAGAIVGGLIFSAIGGALRHDVGILAGALLSGLCMFVIGSTREAAILSVATFVYGASIPITNASSQTLWQAQVPPEFQGRVFTFRRMIAWMLNPLAMLVSIPMARFLYELRASNADGSAALDRFWPATSAGSLALLATLCGLYSIVLASTLLLTNALANERPGRPPMRATP